MIHEWFPECKIVCHDNARRRSVGIVPDFVIRRIKAAPVFAKAIGVFYRRIETEIVPFPVSVGSLFVAEPLPIVRNGQCQLKIWITFRIAYSCFAAAFRLPERISVDSIEFRHVKAVKLWFYGFNVHIAEYERVYGKFAESHEISCFRLCTKVIGCIVLANYISIGAFWEYRGWSDTELLRAVVQAGFENYVPGICPRIYY